MKVEFINKQNKRIAYLKYSKYLRYKMASQQIKYKEIYDYDNWKNEFDLLIIAWINQFRY